MALNKEKTFTHIPDWFKWEREQVDKELDEGTYRIDVDVKIYGLKDTNCLYSIGEGHLHHDQNGFVLEGCNGKLKFKTSPLSQYSLYSDYYWYEIGDMVSIGDNDVTYYCFPINQQDIAAKARIATEEIFKKAKSKKIA